MFRLLSNSLCDPKDTTFLPLAAKEIASTPQRLKKVANGNLPHS